jgi:excisionase family DNA binding protein
MSATSAPEWLTPAQAARALGLTPIRVRQLVDAGRLDAQRTPLGRLVRASAVAAMAAERQQAADAAP